MAETNQELAQQVSALDEEERRAIVQGMLQDGWDIDSWDGDWMSPKTGTWVDDSEVHREILERHHQNTQRGSA